MTKKFDNTNSGALFITDTDNLLTGPFQLQGTKKALHRLHVAVNPGGASEITLYKTGKNGRAVGKPIAKGTVGRNRSNNPEAPTGKGILRYREQDIPLCFWRKEDSDTGHYYYQVKPDRIQRELPSF